MTINWIQAAILGLFACLCSNSCMAGQAVGNYTIGLAIVERIVAHHHGRFILVNAPGGGLEARIILPQPR